MKKILCSIVAFAFLLFVQNSFACDKTNANTRSFKYIGGGVYELEVEFCVEPTNGGQVFGLLMSAKGANIINSLTPSIIGPFSSNIGPYNTPSISIGTYTSYAQWGYWGDNTKPLLLDDVFGQEACWVVVVQFDDIPTQVNMIAESGTGGSASGVTVINGLQTCPQNISIPSPVCDASWSIPSICDNSTSLIDMDTWTAGAGIWSASPSAAISGTKMFDPNSISSSTVDVTLTVDDGLGGTCSSTKTISALQSPTRPINLLSNYSSCNTDLLLDASLPLIPGSCTYTVDLIQVSYSDGWNGASLDILINGVVYSSGNTVSSSQTNNLLNIPVKTGDVVSFIYNNGSYDNENGIRFYDSNGGLLYSQNTPKNSLQSNWTFIASCIDVNHTYNWNSSVDFVPPSTINDVSPTVNVSTNRNYTVTITNPQSGCQSDFSTTIACSPSPACNISSVSTPISVEDCNLGTYGTSFIVNYTDEPAGDVLQIFEGGTQLGPDITISGSPQTINLSGLVIPSLSNTKNLQIRFATDNTCSFDFDLIEPTCPPGCSDSPGLNGVASDCNSSTSLIDLFTSLNGTPDAGTGIWTETTTGISSGVSFNGTTGTLNPTGLSAGVYTYDYTTCTGSSRVTVTITAIDDASFTMIGKCDGGTVNSVATPGGIYSFTSSPTDGAIISSSTGEVTGGTPGSIYNITYTTTGACANTSTVILTALPLDNAGFNYSSIECLSATPILTGLIGGKFSFTTPPLHLATLDEYTGVISNGVYGATYDITYTTNNCVNTSSEQVTLLNAISFDTITTPVSCIPLTDGTAEVYNVQGANNSTYNYTWSSGENTALITDKSSGNYTVTVSDLNALDCSTSEVITIDPATLNCPEPDLYVPSAFSPDGNGENDILYVRGTAVEALEFYVFDRWGKKVFESTDLNIGWDGTYKGNTVDDGVYMYRLKAVFSDGSEQELTGDVTIIR